jgi:hypothetical protein
MDLLHEFLHNVKSNLFQPLLLFFYAGFLIPIFRVAFEFPHQVYQGLTLYLLLAIGWEGGEKLAKLDPAVLEQALGFMVVGFVLNFFIGIVAFILLRTMTRLRKVDAATVAGYYGSDSAGTFVTCVGVLTAAQIAYAPYMPVMLAVMEIPGCLVALYLVSRLRHHGMDGAGNMPDEPGYKLEQIRQQTAQSSDEASHKLEEVVVAANGKSAAEERETVAAGHAVRQGHGGGRHGGGGGHGGHDGGEGHAEHGAHAPKGEHSIFSAALLHEVFLNPGLYLLFAGIVLGFVSGKQGADTHSQDMLFHELFKGILCLFLLEMGITASKRIRDLKTAGVGFIAYGLIAPNLFATTGIVIAHVYSSLTGAQFEMGTYVLFAVLCGAASYIAVPAVQRLAIPEASPTLPLAASLGLTFSYNVTIGIPVYMMITKTILSVWPV